MANSGARLKPETIREVAFGSITNAFVQVGPTFLGPIRILYLGNQTDKDMYFAFAPTPPAMGGYITAISNANPGQVTSPNHGLKTGDQITISLVVGMTQVNNRAFTITVVDGNNFTIGVNTTAYSAYVSGGQWIGYAPVQPAAPQYRVAANSFRLLDCKTNDGFFDAGSSIWVKYVAAPASGLIYVEATYS